MHRTPLLPSRHPAADVTLSVAMTTASTIGAVVATPLITQLLLGTLVPVDALGLLISTLQVRGRAPSWSLLVLAQGGADRAGRREWRGPAADFQRALTSAPASLPSLARCLFVQVVLLAVVVGAAINTAFPTAVVRLGSVFGLTAGACPPQCVHGMPMRPA